MVLPVQSPQLAQRVGRLPHSARRRMRHNHLRSAQDRHHAKRRQPCPAASRGGCGTCSSWIGIPIVVLALGMTIAFVCSFSEDRRNVYRWIGGTSMIIDIGIGIGLFIIMMLEDYAEKGREIPAG